MIHLLRTLLLVVAVLLGTLAQAQAQSEPAQDQRYPLWEDVASAAESRIDGADNVSVEDFERLRSNIVLFRSEFSTARGVNADRIRTLEDQITALGPVPESGAEAEEVAAKRAELEAQLENLRAPARVAEAAFRRAEGLIGEIDAIIREREARRLLSLGPSPLDPRTWPVAVEDIGRILGDVGKDVAVPDNQQARNRLQDRLPLILLLSAVSLTLIVRGRRWAGNAIDYMRSFGGRGTGVWSFLVSLLRIILPLAGVYILTFALQQTGFFGETTGELLRILPVLGLILLGFRWLAERLFAREDDAVLALSFEKRKSMRFYMMLLSLLFVSRGLVDVIFNLEQAEPQTVAFLTFPLVVLIGTVLFFMGLVLRSCGRAEPSEETPRSQKASYGRGMRLFGTVMVAVGVASPVMVGIGYAEAGNALLYPTILSLLLLGLVMTLQRFAADVYGLASGEGNAARDGLIAIFAGFVLTLLALPLLALIWGARVADLTEVWTQFLQGFDIGGTRISPANFMTFVVVFAIGYTVTRVLQSTLRQNVLPKTRIDIGGQNALVSGTGYVGIFLSALVAVTVAGLDLSGIAIVAGALSVGIGFGLQTVVSNFVSGIILLIERPISEGDWIEVGGKMGYVKDISVRSTRIETFDRTDVIVPNSDLISGTVTNYTRGNTIGRLIVAVGVAYGTDTRKVERILREIAEAQPMVLSNPPPNVVFMGFGADSLDFEIRAILRDVNWMLSVKSDINHEIAARFAEAGIEIPFAQRDIWIRNPEALRSKDISTELPPEDEPTDEEDRSDTASQQEGTTE